jgi:diaphanous 1
MTHQLKLVPQGAVLLFLDAPFYELFNAPQIPSPFSAKARHSFRFSVPDEWYRRSRPRSTSSLSLEPSESTTNAIQDTEMSSEEEDGGDGTAKQGNARPESDVSPQSRTKSTDWRQSLSQARLSSVFENWLRPSTPTSPTRAHRSSISERMSVSEPKPMERTNSDVDVLTMHSDTGDVDLDMDGFEEMLVCTKMPT